MDSISQCSSRSASPDSDPTGGNEMGDDLAEEGREGVGNLADEGSLIDPPLPEQPDFDQVRVVNHIEIETVRELDETPPCGEDPGEQSPISPPEHPYTDDYDDSSCCDCGSPTPPPSQTPRPRKRKHGDSESSDENDCSSKKPNSERDKTDGRKGKLLSKERPPPHVQAWLQEIATWPKAEQNLGLERLLATICDAHQLRLVRQLIEPHFQRDFISLLPKEVRLL